MKRMILILSAILIVGTTSKAKGADFVENATEINGNVVTIRPKEGQAKVVRLEVMNDNIIRVRATSDESFPQKPASLIIVPQTVPAKNTYTVNEEVGTVEVTTKNVKAIVSKDNGEIAFFDAAGKQLLKEAKGGKLFMNFTVPEREYGLKGGPAITEAMKHGLTWQIKFDSPDDEAFYGLGHHQS